MQEDERSDTGRDGVGDFDDSASVRLQESEFFSSALARGNLREIRARWCLLKD